MARNNIVEHNFYCIKCGNKGIPLSRRASHQRGSFHRKKLYCIYCKEEVNHIECRDFNEVEKFKRDFERGAYIDEAKESVSYVRTKRIGQIDLDK